MDVRIFLGIGIFSALILAGCSSTFKVNSDPLQADVYFQDTKTGEKKPLGKTPLNMTMSELHKIVGDVPSGSFFAVSVEKTGFMPQSYSIPATRFGTTVTQLDVKMKTGEAPREERLARNVLEHLFLAQKLALSGQFERAQIEIDKILVEFPGFPRALSMRASIYFAQKNYPESLKWYEEALKADPQMEDAVKMAAKVRVLAGGRVPSSLPSANPAGVGGGGSGSGGGGAKP